MTVSVTLLFNQTVRLLWLAARRVALWLSGIMPTARSTLHLAEAVLSSLILVLASTVFLVPLPFNRTAKSSPAVITLSMSSPDTIQTAPFELYFAAAG